ncbi:unnamed protein product [Mytilus coruscus]|uniref:Zinc finger PHD-type domain-containing protein n=1 Tax=Mytilus coruscus TaxID=42192 RepID=A0A6J8CNA0_MYTCO|nr:unnamed protein product [Mytilus coruscus]
MVNASNLRQYVDHTDYRDPPQAPERHIPDNAPGEQNNPPADNDQDDQIAENESSDSETDSDNGDEPNNVIDDTFHEALKVIRRSRKVREITKFTLSENKHPFIFRPSYKTLTLLFLLRSDNIHNNPGPPKKNSKKKPKYPCTNCKKGVIATSKAISCDLCEQWSHVRCTKTISIKQYEEYFKNNTDFSYICDNCSLQHLPFNNDEHTNDQSEDTAETRASFNITSQNHDDLFRLVKRKGLHFIQCNARSLLPKLSEIKIVAAKTKAAVISITVSWLDNAVTNAEIHIEGYNIVRLDRSRNDGGVCVFIKEDIAFSPRQDLHDNRLEALWIDIVIPKTKTITIGTVYRPPKRRPFLLTLKKY